MHWGAVLIFFVYVELLYYSCTINIKNIMVLLDVGVFESRL